MALIILIENLLTALDSGNCAVGIFLDFQKAFDTVDHNILLDKLHWYGIRGTAHEWFCSYLHNRKQSAIFNGYESEYKLLKWCVPQGSIFGPLLFLVYINDLPSVSDLFMPILFADDTNLFCTGKDLKALSHKINEEIAKIYAWVNANKLSLNIDKTNFMLFTPRNSSRCIDDIVINGIRIAEVTETKFLGVIIDNTLKWSTHILYTRKKIAKGIGILLKARKCFNNETLLSLYHTFVYPYLSYCIHVWDRAFDTHLNELIVLQNKIIRIINGVPPRTNVERLYVTMGILSLKRIYNYAIGLFMYKYVNNMLPELFVDFFSNVTYICITIILDMQTETPSMLPCTVPHEDNSPLITVVLVSGILFSVVWCQIVQLVCSKLHHVNCFSNPNAMSLICRVYICYSNSYVYEKKEK